MGCVENQSDITHLRQLRDNSEMPKTHVATNIEYGQLYATLPFTVVSVLTSLVVHLTGLLVRIGFSAIPSYTSSGLLLAVGSLVTRSGSLLMKLSAAVVAAAGAPVGRPEYATESNDTAGVLRVVRRVLSWIKPDSRGMR